VPLTIYQYPNCSTCKKALAWLAKHGYAFTSIDIVKSPPSRAALKRAHELAKVPVRKMFNVAGESYRAGNYKTKLETMTDAQAFAALAADGKLIKRPLLVSDDADAEHALALFGFSETDWRHALS
jgi:arsenate reductase